MLYSTYLFFRPTNIGLTPFKCNTEQRGFISLTSSLTSQSQINYLVQLLLALNYHVVTVRTHRAALCVFSVFESFFALFLSDELSPFQMIFLLCFYAFLSQVRRGLASANPVTFCIGWLLNISISEGVCNSANIVCCCMYILFCFCFVLFFRLVFLSELFNVRHFGAILKQLTM